jgi:hypothetical protein
MSRAVNPRNPCAFCESFSYLCVDAYIHLTSKHFFDTWTLENVARLRHWVSLIEKRSSDKPLDPTMLFRLVLKGYKKSIPVCIVRKRCYFKNPEYYTKGLELVTTGMWLDEARKILMRGEERYTVAELNNYQPSKEIQDTKQPVEPAKPIPLTPDQEKFSLMEKLIEKLMKSTNDLQRQVEVQEEQLSYMKKKTDAILDNSQAIVSRCMNRLARNSIDYDDIPKYEYENITIDDIEADVDDIEYNHTYTPVTVEKKYPMLYQQIYAKEKHIEPTKANPLTPNNKPPLVKKLRKEFRQIQTVGEYHIFSPPTVDE